MNALEKSVQRLAGALDALEARLEERIADLSAKSDAIDQAKVRARSAKTQAAGAAEDLADAIAELRSMLGSKNGR
ncbi:MAG: hypothetical protein ACOZAA_12355 [Pseudomonadota bacterium]